MFVHMNQSFSLLSHSFTQIHCYLHSGTLCVAAVASEYKQSVFFWVRISFQLLLSGLPQGHHILFLSLFSVSFQHSREHHSVIVVKSAEQGIKQICSEGTSS